MNPAFRYLFRRGQFGNTLVDIIVWLIVIGIATYFIAHYIVGGGSNVITPAENIAGGLVP